MSHLLTLPRPNAADTNDAVDPAAPNGEGADEAGAQARQPDVERHDPTDPFPWVMGFADADEERDWQGRGLCAQTDPDAFFPEKGGSTREAKRICSGCDVRAECLQYALDHDERFGIWGGLSERERRRLRRSAI